MVFCQAASQGDFGAVGVEIILVAPSATDTDAGAERASCSRALGRPAWPAPRTKGAIEMQPKAAPVAPNQHRGPSRRVFLALAERKARRQQRDCWAGATSDSYYTY